jgi:predicted DNA-binding transcriptional regulator YafY
MPKASLIPALVRQWEILKKIPTRRPGITAKELTDYLNEKKEYKVSKRTVERDLVNLAEAFRLGCNDESIPYGWYWISSSKCDFSSIDLADALSLVLTESLLVQLLPESMLDALKPKFDLARKKLSAVDTHRYARWAEKIRYIPANQTLLPPKVQPKVLATVQEALLSDLQLDVLYTGPQSPKAQNLTLHPLGLVQRGSTPYLVATTFEYPDVRLYAIHRMSQATLSSEPAATPPDFKLDTYLATGALNFGAGDTIILKAWLTDDLAIHLTETPLSTDQQIVYKAKRYHLTATVKDTWQLHYWILSQGSGITIISPAELKAAIADTVKAASANYA